MAGIFSYLGNPERFTRFSRRAIPICAVLGALLLAYGLYKGVITGPEEKYQGKTVYIMYIHVPCAWLAMFGYVIMAIAALGTLVWRHPLADSAARACAPIGAVFTAVALITGALWGKPTWGTYWTWDARITSVLILLIMYLGLMGLARSLDRSQQSSRLIAILTLVGVINIPIIKFSVEWWNSLHQPASILRREGVAMAPEIFWPLIQCAIGLSLIFIAMHLFATRTDILRRRRNSLRAKIAHKGA